MNADRVDYLLVVGPGRSGSDFLYRILRAHPDYAIPEIKESAYYRSVRAYQRGRTKVRPPGKLLCDIANDAYHDPKLLPGVRALQQQGVSILVMVLLRSHRDRALSAMRFRKSRGRPSALLGAQRLEESVVRDRLTPQMLEDIFRLDVDVLTVDFATLVGETDRFLAKLAALCRTAPFDDVPADAVNVSTRARFVWLSTLGWLSAVVLRGLGLNSLLQRIKDSPVAQGYREVLLPGEREAAVARERTRDGIPVAEAIWTQITEAATKLGVSPLDEE